MAKLQSMDPTKVRTSSRSLRRARRTRSLAAVLLGSGIAAIGIAGGSTVATATTWASAKSLTGTLTVEADSVREPSLELFEKSHPGVHLKIDLYGNASTTLQTQVELDNRSGGSGLPDVAFIGDSGFLAWAPYEPSNFAAPLNGLVPQSTINKFAANSLSGCEINGKLYCLRNDIGADVLWYNQTLMTKFGYQVPTTWAQYETLGLEVAKQHPGYVIGADGASYSDEDYFQASQCPETEVTGMHQVRVDLESANCTRMAKLLSLLNAAGSVSTLSDTSNDYVAKYGATDHILMQFSPTYFGQFVFEGLYKTPAGQMTAAPPPAWKGDKNWTGDVGGGYWVVSTHAANKVLAAELVTWMTTSSTALLPEPTYPAYGPAALAWTTQVTKGGYFASSPVPAFKDAAGLVWPGLDVVPFAASGVYASAVVPGLAAGKSLTSLLPAWQAGIVNLAKQAGWTVETS
jgi:ABC-type glycerol-3-phosphate transport system substrate-binding protein